MRQTWRAVKVAAVLARLISRTQCHHKLRELTMSRPVEEMLDAMQPGQQSDASLDAVLSTWHERDRTSKTPRHVKVPSMSSLHETGLLEPCGYPWHIEGHMTRC